MIKQSPILLIIATVFGCVLLFGLIFAKFHTSHSKQALSAQSIDAQKEKVWDVASGDTNNEVLRTVIANQQQLKKQNEALQKENNELREKGILKLQDKLQKTKSFFENQLAQMRSSSKEKPQTNENDSYEINGPKKSESVISSQNGVSVITSVPDLSTAADDDIIQKDDNRLSTINANAPPTLPSDQRSQKAIPYYTIPAGSTLNHVSLMTSVIGEVPISGHLAAPAFPFKAIVGKKDLFAANGLSIPYDIAGMVLSGYSVGNMTMSCARIYITSALFVFDDGHFVVYPQNQPDNATAVYPANALGYLSDPYGNTCISGKYITDASKVIANMAAMGGIATGAAAVSQAQMTTMENAFQANTKLTGSIGKYIGGAFVNGASQKALDWYTSRVSDIFDAVFIPAVLCGKNKKPHVMQLVFNVTQTIPIDLDLKGRTLNYENHSFSYRNRQLD